MDNIELLLYIVFAVVYFLFKTFGGKKKTAQTNSKPAPQQGQGAPRTKTFEELLREMAGLEALDEEDYEETARARAEKEAQDAANLRQMESKAASYQTIDEQIELDKINEVSLLKEVDADIVDEYENTLAQDIVQQLRSPSDARKAVVLSEIFTRKYQ